MHLKIEQMSPLFGWNQLNPIQQKFANKKSEFDPKL